MDCVKINLDKIQWDICNGLNIITSTVHIRGDEISQRSEGSRISRPRLIHDNNSLRTVSMTRRISFASVVANSKIRSISFGILLTSFAFYCFSLVGFE